MVACKQANEREAVDRFRLLLPSRSPISMAKYTDETWAVVER
jgi:hypothetical protein